MKLSEAYWEVTRTASILAEALLTLPETPERIELLVHMKNHMAAIKQIKNTMTEQDHTMHNGGEE